MSEESTEMITVAHVNGALDRFIKANRKLQEARASYKQLNDYYLSYHTAGLGDHASEALMSAVSEQSNYIGEWEQEVKKRSDHAYKVLTAYRKQEANK